MRHKRFTQPIPTLKERSPIIHHVFVDTESNWSQIDGKTPITRHVLRFGYAKYCRWNGESLVVVSDIVFERKEEFWQWLKRLKNKETTWVWAHNISFDGTLVNLWSVLMGKECKLGHFTDCDLPAFFQCSLKDHPFQFLDSLNIFKASLSKIGDELGLVKLTMPKQDAGMDQWMPYCKRDVDVLHGIVEKWMIFLAKHKLGRMSPSLAGQAMTAYRTRFMHHDIHIHCNEHVIALERDGYYGGLVEPKFVGHVPADHVYEYDVNSLYPYVMKKYKYPNLLIGFVRHPGKDYMADIRRKYYVIAYVRLETTAAVFPVRIKGRLAFPHGNYWTVLHHAELDRAYAMGVVKQVGFASYYTQADIFTEYVDFFYTLRKTFNPETEKVFEYICKLFLNALYGKFGQKRPKWETYTEKILRHMEYAGGLIDGELDILKEHIEQFQTHELKFRHPYNNELYGARRLLGVEQIMCGEGEATWSFPAIAGAVTAYAREYVRNIQAMIPKKCLYYTDTDSFFVNERGRKSLIQLGMVNDAMLGKLKGKTVNEWMVIHGPKDYETNNEVKRKGIRPLAKEEKPGEFTQDQWPGFKGHAKAGFREFVDVKRITKKLRRELHTLQLRDDGWTYPLLIVSDKYKMY